MSLAEESSKGDMVGWRGAAWVESFLRVFEVELWRSDGTVFFLKMLGG